MFSAVDIENNIIYNIIMVQQVTSYIRLCSKKKKKIYSKQRKLNEKQQGQF